MFAALAAAVLTTSCLAPRADYFSVQLGTGEKVDVAGIGWDVPISDCMASGRLRVGMLLRLDGWHGTDKGGQNLLATSMTPFVRYELGHLSGMPIYTEGGLGMTALSKTRIDDQKQFSTAYQFNEFLGVGTRFGSHGQFQVGTRLQHVSNGGIKRPNDGLTYGLLFLNYHF